MVRRNLWCRQTGTGWDAVFTFLSRAFDGTSACWWDETFRVFCHAGLASALRTQFHSPEGVECGPPFLCVHGEHVFQPGRPFSLLYFSFSPARFASASLNFPSLLCCQVTRASNDVRVPPFAMCDKACFAKGTLKIYKAMVTFCGVERSTVDGWWNNFGLRPRNHGTDHFYAFRLRENRTLANVVDERLSICLILGLFL